ncbi:MAG: gluconate:H+ symporter [Peptoniphilus sp.]|uniref:GntP family permease n=1 Tax=Peptoniphilus sp. TaxID=1971214 RepID=UPI002A75C414|nr:gluconate:H+ symporter [Peptoniphilus sp.]MDY2987074.1 gluconate:H+ symporter [Peptoniphilus sp.]
MGELMLSPERMIIAMVIGIVFLVFMILKTKVHTFLALIIASLLIGAIGGFPAPNLIKAITDGFGGTLGSIGVIIGLGVMMGEIFEFSGAAKKMAYTFLKVLGKDKEEIALTITGFLVSIPIFCDSGFVILAPLARALSRQSKKSMVGLGVALASGLVITHSLIPPTPGPIGAAGIFGANIGSLILWGILIAIPMSAACLVYAKYIGKKIYQIPTEDGEGWTRERSEAIADKILADFDENLPSAFSSFLPIIVPIVLILLQNVTALIGVENETLKWIINFTGAPIVAVAVGVLLALFLLVKDAPRDEIAKMMEKGLASAGIIIFVTGGGGALGSVLRTSGVGEYIAKGIATTAIPPLFLPFIIATMMRLIQGSGTVAMLTAASITAPIMSSLGVNPTFATLSACIGSLFFSQFSDSFFWVVNRTMGISDAKEQIRIWSIPTTIAWAIGFVVLLIINGFFG